MNRKKYWKRHNEISFFPSHPRRRRSSYKFQSRDNIGIMLIVELRFFFYNSSIHGILFKEIEEDGEEEEEDMR